MRRFCFCIRAHQTKLLTIKVVHQANAGVSVARNAALSCDVSKIDRRESRSEFSEDKIAVEFINQIEMLPGSRRRAIDMGHAAVL